jgi:ribosomal protein L40E
MASATPRAAEATNAATVCPACNASPARGRFCRKCGATLPQDSTSRTGPMDQPSPTSGLSHQPPLPAEAQGPSPSVQRAETTQTAPRPAPEPRTAPEPVPATAPPTGPMQPRQPTTDPPPPWAEAPVSPHASTNGWAPAHGPTQHPPPAWPPARWPPAQRHAPRWRHSTGFAVTVATGILLVLLAIAATVILLVANGGSNRTGIINQPTVTSPAGETAR